MSIVFFCHNCGARFEVASNLAGKTGRCNRCRERFSIPSASETAPPPATATAKTAAVAAVSKMVSSPSWIAAVNASNVGLKPLTMDRIPASRIARPKPAVVDDFDDTDPYKLAEPVRAVSRGRAIKPVSGVKMLWRRELGGFGKLLRWINETAYLISVPFLMLILIGALLRNRPLALTGATVVVLLNISRLVVGVANLVVYAFKEGVAQGIFFLIPPFTFVYLNKHWRALRKPTKRVIEPAITIGLVILAFTFMPSLSRGHRKAGSFGERVREEAKALEDDISQELSKAKKLKVDSLGEKAQRGLRDLEKGAASAPGEGSR